MLSISRNEVHLWTTFVNEIEEREFREYRKILAPDELERERRYYFPEDRRQFLVSRALLRSALSRYMEPSPEKWRFVRNKRGRPEIRPDLRSLPLRFNLSHTREVIICGLTLDQDIGVDVENVARKTDCAQIAKRYFAESELEDTLSLSEERQTRRFYDYWTLKEAVIKALGEGLYFPLDEFEFSASFHETPSPPAGEETCLSSDENVKVHFHSHSEHNSRTWQFWRFRVGDSHIAAVALKKNTDSPFRLRVKKIAPPEKISF